MLRRWERISEEVSGNTIVAICHQEMLAKSLHKILKCLIFD